MAARFIVGIDLGTTNTACAFVDTAAGRTLHVFEVPQLVAPGEVGARPTLPSFLYLAGAHELPAGSLDPPWATGRDWCVGLFAREQGARVPGRLVASSKSWLCHAAVDRTAAILPWGTAPEVAKVSPVEASARTLTHLREAWDASFPAPLAEQSVVLTVPASFDEVARELTLAAARAAGLPDVVMLEEPQAAFYAWLAANERDWRARVAAHPLVLVVDVGGGTTDLSLIAGRARRGARARGGRGDRARPLLPARRGGHAPAAGARAARVGAALRRGAGDHAPPGRVSRPAARGGGAGGPAARAPRRAPLQRRRARAGGGARARVRGARFVARRPAPRRARGRVAPARRRARRGLLRAS